MARPLAFRVQPSAAVGALAAVTLASLLLRTNALGGGYWIDEAISVGVASHDLGQIPGLLRQDGSPPLYYLLLHEWIALVGAGEAATRALSLLFATLAVPLSWWAGSAVFDRRTGALAAVAAAACPFLTYYAQESRMYALVATVSRGNRCTGVALAGVLVVWALTGSPPEKSNVRAVAADVKPAVRPGDLVAPTQPEQVPVLDRYLPDGLVYVTPLGYVPDPRMTDWRDGLVRLRHGTAQRELEPLVAHLAAGQRVLLVTPAPGGHRSQAPWQRAVRIRTREWRASLRSDPRLHRIELGAGSGLPG